MKDYKDMAHIPDLTIGFSGAEKPQQEKAAAPARETPDAPALASSDTESLAAAFQTMAADARAETRPFHATLKSLSGLIARVQAAGLDEVGMENASFAKLAQYNLTAAPASGVTWCILSILDARILVRVHPDEKIDCHKANIAKPRDKVQEIDDILFWVSPKKFFSYDLKKEEDRIGFLSVILQTAADCQAARELQEFDQPAQTGTLLAKPGVRKP